MEAFGTFLPLILIFVVFYFLLIRPQQRKVKQHKEMLSNLKRGDKIVTSGGIIGTINKVADNRELTLEVAENVEIKIASGMVADLYSIPEVQKNYRITDNREGWAIAGLSSGGICAFTVAWQRPDKFSKVVSHIGSFTNIRGGHLYSDLVRQSSVKPIRIFLQDGSNDLNLRPGNWWIANQQLADSLDFAGYDYMTVWGDGGHDLEHGGAIFPDTMRWLWRDYDSRP